MTTNFEHKTFVSADGGVIHYYTWLPEEPMAILQIAHGMAEHALRYESFAHFLNKNNIAVYANDHRGHGKSALSESNLGYLGGSGSFEELVQDMAILSKIARSDFPDLPLFLLGHSMGSFASQRFIMDTDIPLAGLILSGSNGAQGKILKVALLLAKLERVFKGDRARSGLVNNLAFGKYNERFSPERTDFDWLSRDEKEVDKYIADPFCGTAFPTSFFEEFFKTLIYIEDKKNFHKIPTNLPILIVSGEEDPVGAYGEGVKELYERYRGLGLKDLNLILYEGARHEILNEINKDDVNADILDWLNRHIS